MKLIAILTALIFTQLTGFAQMSMEEDLLFYADIMVNGYEPSTRERGALEFERLFENYIEDNGSLDKTLAFTNYISILPSPDEDFQLVSWMVKLQEGQVDYNGYIVFENKTIKLDRKGTLTEELAYTTTSTDDWYGCLYYKIMKFNKSQFLVFGFDGNGRYDNQRIVDLLTIAEDKITFGGPVFEDKESLGTYLNRIIISYASDASVILHYNPGLERIIHDHLEQRMGQQPGQGPTNIPDGTYEGYELKKGLWKYQKKIFNHVYESAPRPNPVFKDKQKKDKPKEKATK